MVSKLVRRKKDSKKVLLTRTKNTKRKLKVSTRKKNVTINLKQKPIIFKFPENKRIQTLSKLNKAIREVESMQETVRNKRQMSSTAFQNFDQKANQLYNLLSSVMKAMNEMRMGTVRNML